MSSMAAEALGAGFSVAYALARSGLPKKLDKCFLPFVLLLMLTGIGLVAMLPALGAVGVAQHSLLRGVSGGMK